MSFYCCTTCKKAHHTAFAGAELWAGGHRSVCAKMKWQRTEEREPGGITAVAWVCTDPITELDDLPAGYLCAQSELELLAYQEERAERA
tara:strand:- start:810 stop:1076 length:267 start_codon:yes stop_codon:yes gene_type:complete